MKDKRKTLTGALFAVYVIAMVWLLFLQRARPYYGGDYMERVMRSLSLTPLHTIREQIYIIRHSSSSYLVRFALRNLLGNVVLFIPAGYFLPAVWRKMRRFVPFLLTSVLIIVLIELLQLFTLLGSCDIDDLILNVPGMILGYVLYTLTAGRK